MIEIIRAKQPIETTSPSHTEPRGVAYTAGGTYLLWREDTRYTPPCKCRLVDLARMRFVSVPGEPNQVVIEAGEGCAFWEILSKGVLDLRERGKYSFSIDEDEFILNKGVQ